MNVTDVRWFEDDGSGQVRPSIGVELKINGDVCRFGVRYDSAEGKDTARALVIDIAASQGASL